MNPRLRTSLAMLFCVCLAGCSGTATALPPTAAPASTPYAFPAAVDPSSRYMIYLHGKIIEDMGLPAISPEFGDYEYDAILTALAGHGFYVISELRPSDTDADAFARHIAAQIRSLLDAGVPPGHITVVGASKGGYIAALTSFRVEEPGVNYVLMGTCHPDTVEGWKASRFRFHGNVLTIRDEADQEYAGPCEELLRLSADSGLGRHEEIVLHVGTGHGILYKPLDDWILPTVEWATR